MLARTLTTIVAIITLSGAVMVSPPAAKFVGDKQQNRTTLVPLLPLAGAVGGTEARPTPGVIYAQAESLSPDDREVTEQRTPIAGPGYAIAGWIEKIDEAKDWSAEFTDLTYNPANDTALLTGLTIDNLMIDLKIAFKPISITGYSEQDDGTFAAESIATDGATLTAIGLKGIIADVRLDGLGNIATDLSTDATWDPKHPFTSLIRTYSRFIDSRLAHGGIGSVSLVVDDNGDEITLVYEDFSIDNWADGKLASATTGPVKFAAPNSREPFVMTIAGTELRGFDYAAMLRVYDPDRNCPGCFPAS